MKTVAFLGQKGGTGKSTTGVSLAVCAHQDNRRVRMLDCDPQGTWRHWAEHRGHKDPLVQGVAFQDLEAKVSELANGGSVDVCFIDTPGEIGARPAIAMRVADLCLVPCRPSDADIHATKATLELLVELNRPFAIVLSQALPHAMRAGEAQQVLERYGKIVGMPLISRVDHQDCFASGLGASEFNATGAAAAEIRLLWNSIKLRLGSL